MVNLYVVTVNQETIINCYDSHTHFWATGQVAEGLLLKNLRSEDDIKSMAIKKNHYRANWIVGFGWDQNLWPSGQFPNKKILDQVFGITPVFFTRTDGHASWINSQAIIELKRAGYDFNRDPHGGVLHRDERGELTGILLDQAHINALIRLPEFSEFQNKIFLETAQKIFNRSGFTHIRDMSMNLNYWQILKKMEDEKNLNLCIDAFVTVENLIDLPRALKEIELIKKESFLQIRLHGVKIFVDGSLGAKTAYLSQNYILNNGKTEAKGLLIWAQEEIKELLRKTWSTGLEVAIHVIGDEAAHIAVCAAREVAAEGVLGRLHLEHVQILRPETILMMKPLHVICYLQPCHWLSDNKWLKEVLTEKSVKNLFQWELLRKNKIPFYFGSDSPIERPSLFDNQKALNESVKWGVPKLNHDWKFYHSHPDSKWCKSSTEIENGQIKQVYFNSKPLF